MDHVDRASTRIKHQITKLFDHWLGWVACGVVVYLGGMYLTSAIMYLIGRVGLLTSVDATGYSLLVRIIIYAVLVGLFFGTSLWLRQRPTRREMGLERSLEWKDIGIGLAGVVLYFLLAMALLALAKLVPGFDAGQAQELEVGQVYGFARMATFVVLVIITPFAEELIFRGIFYGGLRTRRVAPWAAALIVSVLFAVAHGQLNVGLDVFCLSMVACYARELTGSLWAGVILHTIKNFIAFALVFMIGQV